GGPAPKPVPLADAWIKWKHRRQYLNGLVFQPDGKSPKGTYNLWPGWAVEPDPDSSCRLFLDHLYNVICKGEKEYYEWLLCLLSHMVQRPGEKPRSAIVLRGDKGA